MKFSVIIPLYNKAPYIRKALESVLAQTYADYELIIVDDGSTDGSAEIAEAILASPKLFCSMNVRSGHSIGQEPFTPEGKDLSSKDILPSFQGGAGGRLFRQPNAGVSSARNNGVAQAQGEYLAFLDADDWWEPTYLERMAQLIADHPDAGLYACNYVYYKPGKTHVALNIPTGYINYPKTYYESNAMPVWTGATIIPKSVFEEMGGFPRGIKLGEDFLLWAKIAMHYPVAFNNEPLTYYNNDVPAAMRLTRHLHKPEEHMLFNLEPMDERLKVKGERREARENKNGIAEAPTYSQSPIANSPTRSDWQKLLDKLRVNGLLDYWMSGEYHEQAKAELSKVDWTKQSASVKRMYKTPLWMLKLKRMVMQVGSFVKQKLRMMNILISRRMQNESINR